MKTAYSTLKMLCTSNIALTEKNAKQNCPTIYNYQMNPNKRP